MKKISYPTTLSGLRRRSKCCHAAVDHKWPIDSHWFFRTEVLICMKCMAEIVPNDNFEVVNALDEVVWPVPRGFKVTKALAAKLDSKAGASFTLHLPLKIQRGLFK